MKSGKDNFFFFFFLENIVSIIGLSFNVRFKILVLDIQ